MNIEHMTVNDLLIVLQWMQDRAAYWDDCKMEADVVRELARRGYMPGGGVNNAFAERY